MNRMFLLLTILLIASCGESLDSTSIPSANVGATGSIKAIVTGSKSFNPNISHGKIINYKVTITGEGILEPLIAEFDGTAESGLIENVPSGEERTIKVEAINPNKLTIREGETIGITVDSGDVTETEVKMESVPIFMNVTDGNSIPNTRFIAKIFSESGFNVTLEDEFNGAASPVFDVASSNIEITPDISSGAAAIHPSLLPEGVHKLTVKNVKTGKSSTVSVRITDGAKQKAAPIFSSGSNLPARFGQIAGKSY